MKTNKFNFHSIDKLVWEGKTNSLYRQEGKYSLGDIENETDPKMYCTKVLKKSIKEYQQAINAIQYNIKVINKELKNRK